MPRSVGNMVTLGSTLGLKVILGVARGHLIWWSLMTHCLSAADRVVRFRRASICHRRMRTPTDVDTIYLNRLPWVDAVYFASGAIVRSVLARRAFHPPRDVGVFG